MATSRHIHPKDKAAAAPSPGGGRRSPKPPGSPDRHQPATADHSKPTAARTVVKPKPAASPSSTIAKSPATAGKRQPPAKKPAEKPPSPSRVPQRALPNPATSRDKSAKPLSPSTSPLPRPSLSSRSTTLAGSNKGPGKAVGGPKAGTMTRSKSLNKRKSAHPAPGVVAETSSASDSEVVIKKAVLQTVHGPEKELPVHGDNSPRTDGEQELDEAASLAVSTNAEEATTDDIVSDHQTQEPKPLDAGKEASSEGGVEEAEAAPVSGSSNDPVIEPVEETKPAGTMEAPVKGSGAPGNEAQRRNDVIEEAKSKFLAKRKNSVLALVGAFETVMVQQSPPPRKNKDVEVETKETNEPTKSENDVEESTKEEESNESTELTEAAEEPNESAQESEVIAPMIVG